MKRYMIENANCDITEGGFSCGPIDGSVVVTVKFKENGSTHWLSLVEVEGTPNLFLFDKDVHDELVKEDFADEEFSSYMEDHSIDEFNGIEFGMDYSDIFESISEDPENPAVPLIKYLIALARCDMEETGDLIDMATGKYADELIIPVSDVEEEYLADYEEEENEESDSASSVDQNKELMYRMRLSLEADVATESIYHDLDDDAFKAEKRELRTIKARCENETEYEAWKDAFLSREYKKLNGKKFLVCTYIFAGIDQYEIVIPEEERESFLCWIDGNGGAFFGGDREATEEEVKKYIALHASDEL